MDFRDLHMRQRTREDRPLSSEGPATVGSKIRETLDGRRGTYRNPLFVDEGSQGFQSTYAGFRFHPARQSFGKFPDPKEQSVEFPVDPDRR
jgi:hypothetical protein